jgi:hypothetical protein
MKKIDRLFSDESRDFLKLRIAFWKEVLAELNSSIENGKIGIYGDTKIALCRTINRILRNNIKYPYANCLTYTVDSSYPEMCKYKPKKGWAKEPTYWWNPYLKKSQLRRATVVESVIKDLETELENRPVKFIV